MDVVIALVLGASGLLLLCFLVTVLWTSLFGDLKTLVTRIAMRRKVAELERFTQALQSEDLAQARAALQRSLCLQMTRDEGLIERISNHHFKVLEQIVVASRTKTVRLDKLPVLEDLFHSRTQLLRGLADTSRSLSTLHTRGKEKGSATPPWALQEYERRLVDINDRLQTNRKSLTQQLDDIVGTLLERKPEKQNDSEVTYH